MKIEVGVPKNMPTSILSLIVLEND